MNKRIMVVIGISLILISVVFMVFWETQGRELVMNKKVIAAGRDISAGEEFRPDNITVLSIPKDVIISDALLPEEFNEYLGKKFKHDISKNSQISVNSFILQENEIEDDMSIFQIKSDWIGNMSSSVRKGDIVNIFACSGTDEPQLIGEFYVAFAKDGSGREVSETTGISEPRILERTNGISVPTGIEIAADLEDYTKIIKLVSSGKNLLVLQKGVSFSE